ncbi:MAG TPA: FAD-dependent oxidoreductase [Mycobacteriales bacterium]|nr:FAD-dependent oxidoreductase [Mycobacteriales bacterium]
MTTSLERGVRAELEDLAGAEHVRVQEGDFVPFSRDATPLFWHSPDAVVFPRSADEVAAVLRLATRRRIPVVPRGQGSNLCAAAVPVRGGIVLSLTRMNRILEVSRDELLAVCEPGVTTYELAQAADARGLLYATPPTRAAPRCRRWAATWPPARGACAG